MTRSAQLDAEIAEVLASPRSGARALHWEQRYTKAAELRVGDVILSGSLPPYTAHEVTQIEPAPRKRLRFQLVRLPDRERSSERLLRPTDTIAVPIDARSGAAREDHATKRRIPDDVRNAIAANAVEFIENSYRRHAIVGGREPCLTVGLVTDYLRQTSMPEDFRWATKDRQRTWTRSVLEALRRKGQIGSSLGGAARCYEPVRSDSPPE